MQRRYILATLSSVTLSGLSSASIFSLTSGDLLHGNRSLNLVQNGSFEADAGFAANGSYWANGSTLGPVMSLTGWSTLGQAHTYATWGNDGTGGIKGSANLPDGANGLYFGGGIMGGTTPAPTFHANGRVTFPGPPTFFSKPDQAPVELWQTLTGLSTSSKYLLDFWASGENSKTSGFPGGDGIFGLDITGENSIYLAAPSGVSGLGTSQRYYVLFQPTASSVTLKWTNWGHLYDGTGPHTELVLDDVIVNQVTPEPASLCALGLGLAAVCRRRKRSAKA